MEYSMSHACHLLGIPVPNGRRDFCIPCPCCDDEATRTKRLNINIEKNVFRCPKCNEQGGVLEFYSFMTGVGQREAYAAVSGGHRYEGKLKIVASHSEAPIESALLPIEERDEAYRLLFDSLQLSDKHMTDLKKRGLTEDDIKTFGYKSPPAFGRSLLMRKLLDSNCPFDGVPGFYRDDSQHWDINLKSRGFLIPVRNPDGEIQGVQIRLDTPIDGQKYLWLSSGNMLNGTRAKTFAHFSKGNGSKPEIILTEGPLKGDIISYFTGKDVIAVPGVNCLKQLAEMLEHPFVKGRKILIAYDMDFVTNCHVQEGLVQLKKLLSEKDYEYDQLVWNPYYKGYDDYLLSKKNNK